MKKPKRPSPTKYMHEQICKVGDFKAAILNPEYRKKSLAAELVKLEDNQ